MDPKGFDRNGEIDTIEDKIDSQKSIRKLLITDAFDLD